MIECSVNDWPSMCIDQLELNVNLGGGFGGAASAVAAPVVTVRSRLKVAALIGRGEFGSFYPSAIYRFSQDVRRAAIGAHIVVIRSPHNGSLT